MLGEHVKQAGSLVAPDRLRFDFSHYEPLTADEITRIENVANAETLANTPVRAFETSKQEAEDLGAIAFFGEKYGDVVRVLEAGSSVELCGGTHVSATGDIGTIKIVSEGSIGSNLRRIEAVTGTGSVALLQRDEHDLGEIANLVGTPGDATGGVRRKLDELRALNDEIKQLRAKLARGQASELADGAVDGVVVHRRRRAGAERAPRAGDRRAQRARRRRRRSSPARRPPAAWRWPRRSRPDRRSRRRPDPRRRQSGWRRRRRQGRCRHCRRQGSRSASSRRSSSAARRCSSLVATAPSGDADS